MHCIFLLLSHRQLKDFWRQSVLNCAVIRAFLGDRQDDDRVSFIEEGFTGEERI